MADDPAVVIIKHSRYTRLRCSGDNPSSGSRLRSLCAHQSASGVSASLNSEADGPCGQCELVLPLTTACTRCASTSSEAQARGVMQIWQVTRCKPVAVAAVAAAGLGSREDVEQCATRESHRIKSPASALSSVGEQSTSSCIQRTDTQATRVAQIMTPSSHHAT